MSFTELHSLTLRVNTLLAIGKKDSIKRLREIEEHLREMTYLLHISKIPDMSSASTVISEIESEIEAHENELVISAPVNNQISI